MAGEKTGLDMRDDKTAYEDPNVVNSVAQHLEQFGSEESSIPEPPASSADESESTSKSEVEVQSESTEKDESILSESESQAAGEKSEKDEKPPLPDNYFRAAQHQGWEPEEITEFYNKDPEKAVKTFGKIYESTNNLSQQFAAAGRAAIELQKKTQPIVQPQVVEPKPTMDVEKLRKQYEDDPFGAMVELVKGVTQKPEPAPQATQIPQTVTAINRQTFEEDMAVLQQLNQFYGAEDMKAYESFYGAAKSADGVPLYDWRVLTPGQQANRQAVVNLADQIISGAELQGKQMSVAQGLELAHLSVTRSMSEEVVRDKIVSAVKKRSKGITLKPSGAKTLSDGVAGGGQKTEEQATINAEARLKALREKGL